MYKVSEVSDMLGVSKQTIYKKLTSLKKELKPFIKMKQGIRYIENEGVEIIKESIQILRTDTIESENKLNGEINENSSNQANSINLNKFNQLQEDYINSLKDTIERLENQLKVKDNQLENKDIQLNNKDELLRNFQVLMRNQEQIQCENKKLLEYIAVSRDEPEKENFWEKLFGRSKKG